MTTPEPLQQQEEDEIQAPQMTNDDTNDTLLSMNFNQDGGCLSISTATGFRICNLTPKYMETFRRSFGRGIALAEMLFRCNILALVGGGSSPQYPPNKILMWDDHKGVEVGQILLRQRVLNVKMRRNRICVATRDRVYVYGFAALDLLDTIVTWDSLKGLLAISTDAGGGLGNIGEGDDCWVLACPSTQKGQVRVELYGKRKNLLIDAHEGHLAALALSVDGSLLATASERGTIIRLFETGQKVKPSFGESVVPASSSIPPGTPIREFRRGVESASISCLAFSMDRSWLACTSDHETTHIFQVYKEENSNSEKEKESSSSKFSSPSAKAKSSLSYASKYAKKILPSVLTNAPKKYLQGEQSFAQVRGGITNPEKCCFIPDQPHTIAVVGRDDYGNGCIMISNFGEEDGNGQSYAVKGEAKRIAFHRFFKKGMDKYNLSKNRPKEVYTGESDVVMSDEHNAEQNVSDGLNQDMSQLQVDGGVDSTIEEKKELVPGETEGALNSDENEKPDDEKKLDASLEENELNDSDKSKE